MAELGPVLELAIEAAVAAGDLIRRDFHRPDGPRGHGDHADADTEADLLIRARLRGAYPDWSYFGEETGWDGPRRPETYWLVDPNDGTSSYLRGRRGSAVSIALIRGELPVLGVVYAPTAPDDAGDLIAWAEGLPLTRDGRPVAPALPEQRARGGVALVSLAARRAPLGYSRVLDPLRFRAMPSIAYRLALNAVGDGDATVTFSGPDDYDVAGGHALLRGAGGDLFHADGSPVRYGAATRHSAAYFGGTPALAAELAALDWSPVRTPDPADPLEAAYPAAQPVRGRAIADPGVLSRAQGCLLGQLAGDALGSLVEFQPAEAILRHYPDGVRDLADGGHWDTIAGQPTDDSELALMLARTLVRDGGFDAAQVRAAYRAWYDSHPFDIGYSTRAALTGHPNPATEANGSLMRLSPLGIFGYRLEPARLTELAREDSRLTHPNPVCADAGAAFAMAVAYAIRTGEGPDAVYAAIVEHAERAHLHLTVRDALASAAHRAPAGFDGEQQGWVLIALQNAFYRLLHAPTLEQGVIDTVLAGGDTDTTAAIAGALLGAVYGRAAVPNRWRRAILACRPLAGLPGVHRPRGRPFWPVDALELAEALLLAREGS